MSTNLPLLLVVGFMAACGVYLLMERSLVRMLFGLLLCGNALNLMIIVVSGGMGNPPILGRSSENRATDADPLAQGMVLTAIVITMGVAAFVLALVYRLFVINRDDDDVEDDVEDVKIKTGTLDTAPDRDRSDDPVTLSDTVTGDYFDDAGNPLTPEEVAERHSALHETDIMPTDSDVIDEIGSDDTEDDPDVVGDKVPDDDSGEPNVIGSSGEKIAADDAAHSSEGGDR
ncbi:Na(+)/H(+) antiporter subunit C [Gordonia amicalis]|uniref:Na(+)/H(+) antiporter subunit C n=1 Tax=Gordonia amicalis TaxID=89053 RepID=A0AAE4R8M0_9ACTN|nr:MULTISPECIES: Na(+)/H(+) antiporter subunit C [Gordonia]MBA5845780.1 Na(+)/H(+) antiporter subunit C [Gordonia amicalis]MCZ0911327.1 Na(+)/H(+) antiporter subunit C [Gordonia amicalis]MCZ4581748.1 Na(+)/H(+) antiporter subunit C [Gordonia amicalis]MCZ4650160.1 Na(+)/H(+) antiporter subunit C [Gordonia amicalis]MDV6313872.1 Na(+)/H(+) antiporter subunit C [Gordonia amicalis]